LAARHQHPFRQPWFLFNERIENASM
jgi:hypothetical protein